MSPAARTRPFLTAEWRYLVMLSYEIDPAVLAPLVPAATELDLWQGRALVSVVGFRFLGTRVLGLPVPLHTDFDEVNLRFHVRHLPPGGDARQGATVEYEVTHPVWRVWAALDAVLVADVTALYGPAFAGALSRPPVSALVAEGSPVVVHSPRRLVSI